MAHSYLVYSDKRFAENALKELGGKPVPFAGKFFITKSSASKAKTLEKAKRSTFTEWAAPIVGTAKLGKSYSQLIKTIAKLLKKDDTFTIEVINSRDISGTNAKSIEVLLGTELEKKGFVADLRNPSLFLYVILQKGEATICALSASDDAPKVLDVFRADKKIDDKLNRAQLKLKDAFERFPVPKKIGTALDLGSAPGGWAAYLLKKGMRVVAVDNALLEYDSISAKAVIAAKKQYLAQTKKLASKFSTKPNVVNINGIPKDFRLLHIRLRAGELKAKQLTKIGGVDMLTIDMNIYPRDCAGIANGLADSLNKGACLIMTIKLMTPNVDKHIKNVEKTLSKKYTSRIIKKLPHNRMELTLFAVKK